MNPEKPLKSLRRAVAGSLDDIGDSKTCSAVQAAVWQGGELLLDEALGCTHFGEGGAPMTRDTPMDIASLTKPLVVATLVMQAVDAGLVALSDPIAEHLPAWLTGARGDNKSDKKRAEATLLDLLNHSSGLPAWEKFYLEYPVDPSPKRAQATRDELFERIATTPLEAEPGTRHAYSDLGYILWANILERVFDAPLHEVARARIFEPLDMQQTGYVARWAGDPPITHAAATEDCPLRERVVVGTVHDENTDIIGGTSGHAGVFSTAGDLLEFCTHLWQIDAGAISDGLVSRQTLQFCWSDRARGADGHHLGGWDTPSGELSSAGRGFQAGRTVGHLGFTGTSFWIERDLGLIAILLTNRVYPSRENALIKRLRVRFHEAVLPPGAIR
ncbi:MAG: serine hydrolase domain-containing protein [Persicimonas sp.]